MNLKVFFRLLFSLVWVVWGLSASVPAADKPRFLTQNDLNRPDCIIGGEVGTLSLRTAQEKLSNATYAEFTEPTAVLPALQDGKVDAFAYDKASLDFMAAANPDFFVLPDALGTGRISIVAALDKKELMAKIDEYLRQYYADGTYQKMYDHWVKSKDLRMPVIPRPKHPVGKLVIGIAAENEPMCFYDAELKPAGFDIEVAQRLCLWLNMDYELKEYKYDSLFAACSTHKVDIAIAQMDYTPERAETLLFSEPYINSEIALMIRRSDYKLQSDNEVKKGFFQGIGNSFYKTFIQDSRWKMVVTGLEITILITFCAGLFGTVLAFPVCFARKSENPVLRSMGASFVYLMQGTPILVILLILYYVVFRKIAFDPVYVAIIAFGLNFSAYAGEMLRAGISGIPVGQWDAAFALGMTPSQAFWRVILPQALRQILPVYRGEFINMLKSTSIVGYIAIKDLTKMTDIIRSHTFEAFFPLISTAIIYFVIAWFLTRLLFWCEQCLDPAWRRNRKRRLFMEEPDCKEVLIPADSQPPDVKKHTQSNETVISIHHLQKNFGDFKVLTDVNAEIKRGEIISIIGPSGTGKSTFLRCLNLLDMPTDGEIFVDGEDLLSNSLDVSLVRLKMGMVFQQFNLFGHLTILENITFVPKLLLHLSDEKATKRAMELLKKVGVDDKANALPSELSGGQQQRVAIARALAMNPEFILFDEPTSALDPTMVGEVLDVIRKLAQTGITMLIVTHEMRFAREVSSRVFYMDEGIIYEEGSPKELFDTPKKEKTRVFLSRILSQNFEQQKQEHWSSSDSLSAC